MNVREIIPAGFLFRLLELLLLEDGPSEAKILPNFEVGRRLKGKLRSFERIFGKSKVKQYETNSKLYPA